MVVILILTSLVSLPPPSPDPSYEKETNCSWHSAPGPNQVINVR